METRHGRDIDLKHSDFQTDTFGQGFYLLVRYNCLRLILSSLNYDGHDLVWNTMLKMTINIKDKTKPLIQTYYDFRIHGALYYMFFGSSYHYERHLKILTISLPLNSMVWLTLFFIKIIFSPFFAGANIQDGL